MTSTSSGIGDPSRSLGLLWGVRDRPRTGRGGRRDLSVDRIVRTAIDLADREGLVALSMRRVAEGLGVGTMSLYTYVPGKAELIDLMLDTTYGETVRGDVVGDWRARLEVVARENWELFRRHPWMLNIGMSRPPLGPNVMAKYEHELRTVADLGLDEVEMDSVLNLVLGHAEVAARRATEASATETTTGISDAQWWQTSGPMLAALIDFRQFPVAASVGEAVGKALGTAYDPEHNFEFGLQRILDGVEALVRRRGAEGRTAR